jgi:MAF protein
MQLILASSSPTRHHLLSRLQIPFSVDHPNLDETPRANEKPDALAYRLAEQKAQALHTKYPKHLIIGSDQVATRNGIDAIGKPHNRSEAFSQLMASSGSTVTFYTAVSVLNTVTEQQVTLLEPFMVSFRELNEHEINAYLDREDVLGCAGSFKSEGLGSALFQQLSGNDPTSLMGLPLIKLHQLLLDQGFKILN